MAVLRVFPRRTKATPDDDYVAIGEPGLFIPEHITEIHVSVTFSWDIPEAERITKAWSKTGIAPVFLGGPCIGSSKPADKFIPGMYLKKGYTITSRGCNNNCWFCNVPEREGKLKELEIKEGNIVQDNNLLACSKKHIEAVFDMLANQPRAVLSGGIEAELFKPWHLDLFEKAKIQEAFFAYDTPDDLPPLEEASRLLHTSNWYRPAKARCYVLCGYPGDTIAKAEKRCMTALKLGFFPFAMFFRDKNGKQVKDCDWKAFQRTWARPAAINCIARKQKLLKGGDCHV